MSATNKSARDLYMALPYQSSSLFLSAPFIQRSKVLPVGPFTTFLMGGEFLFFNLEKVSQAGLRPDWRWSRSQVLSLSLSCFAPTVAELHSKSYLS